jgi:hypothetical protein
MIEAIAAVCQFALFAIWNRTDWINTVIKVSFLLLGLALAFESLREFGFIVTT